MTPEYQQLSARGFADWRLRVDGLVRPPMELSLADLKKMRQVRQVTRHRCIQGWSAVAEWTGVPLTELFDLCQPLPQARYPVFYAFPQEEYPTIYYGSIDMELAHHPQTILAYEMNGQPLPLEHASNDSRGLPRTVVALPRRGRQGIDGVVKREGCARWWSTWACPRQVRAWPRRESPRGPRGVEAQAAPAKRARPLPRTSWERGQAGVYPKGLRGLSTGRAHSPGGSRPRPSFAPRLQPSPSTGPPSLLSAICGSVVLDEGGRLLAERGPNPEIGS